jgi:aspartyl/asparaginyl beta-hydroxylase (cupin superfamily)
MYLKWLTNSFPIDYWNKKELVSLLEQLKNKMEEK